MQARWKRHELEGDDGQQGQERGVEDACRR